MKKVTKVISLMAICSVLAAGATGCSGNTAVYKCEDGKTTRTITAYTDESKAALSNFYVSNGVTVSGEGGKYTKSGSTITIKIDNCINYIYRNQEFKGTITDNDKTIKAYNKTYKLQ